MTKLLLRLFVKNWPDTESPKVRSRVGRLSGIVGIVCNLLLFAGKLIIGTLSGSVSITADAMNNLSDATSSIVTVIGFRLAEQPADADHPYGHARYEYLSGLAVAALIIVIGVELAKSSVRKILAPAPILFSLPLAVVLVLSIGVKLWLCLFNRTLGCAIDSSALLATAADSRNDCIATLAVLLAAVTEAIFGWNVDGWFGLAVALFILYSGAMAAKETISPLLGEAASPGLQKLIVDTVRHPKILGYHDLMVHDYGPGQRFASLHVEMDQAEDPLLCHEIIDDLERECLKKHNVHLVIHYDPVITNDERLSTMRQHVVGFLAEYDPQLSLHDFRMVTAKGHTNLVFDIVLPDTLYRKKKDIRQYLEQRLQTVPDGPYYIVVTFDLSAFNQE